MEVYEFLYEGLYYVLGFEDIQDGTVRDHQDTLLALAFAVVFVDIGREEHLLLALEEALQFGLCLQPKEISGQRLFALLHLLLIQNRIIITTPSPSLLNGINIY